ncbi:DUF1835 domain-containing protein [Daejeonella lutea]|uniref:DUF1835 domain-containing protein n=1 Tax=Daejeonella lutea TaxID=572036 RepID=A0A1T5BAX5_9SPHI|nr:DUF1835 domain-containing protein [Daejeonella lutea]SKB44043.1 Protein of unknown function [Daejeonella lutea]
MTSPIHITFGTFAESYVKQSFEFNPALAGEIIALNEDLSIGPLRDIHMEDGRTARTAWLSEIGAHTSSLPYLLSSDLATYEIIKAITSSQPIYIWCGADTKSHLGFLRLMFELSDLNLNIFILRYPKTVQYPIGEFPFLHVGLLRPGQIAELDVLFESLGQAERNTYINDWVEISNSDSLLRMEFGDIKHVGDDYLDDKLIMRCTSDFRGSAWIVGETLADIFDQWQTACGSYLNWRLKELVRMGKLDYQGVLYEIRDYSVRLKL